MNTSLPQTLTTMEVTFSFFSFFVMFLCFRHTNSKIHNHLRIGSSMSVDGDPSFITSPDNSFTCGFYEVGRNAYGFGIWFTHSRDKTVVWMANRDKPVNGKGSKMSLRRDGAMVLTDIDGSNVWQTNTIPTDADKAELLDSGNLVLKDPSGKILWQSFDFPTDTLLPLQTFTKSKKLISATGNGSFFSGYYNMYFNSDNLLLLINDGPDISSFYWPSPDARMWANGRTNYNSTRIAVLDDLGRFSSSDDFKFRASDMGSRIKRRLTLDYDGNLRLYSLNNSSGTWGVSWEAMSQMCSVHGICGRNALCVYTPKPKCSCPPGYEISNPKDWNEGCKPMFSAFCSNRQPVKFVELLHTDYYGFDINSTLGMSLEDCKDICLKDCRCEGFSYRLTGQGVCYTKNSLFNGYRSTNFPGSMYLKLPASLEVPEQTLLGTSSLLCDSSEAGDVLIGSTSMYGMATKRVRWVYLYSFASAIGVIEVVILVAGWLFFWRHGTTSTLEAGYRMISSQFRKFRYSDLKKATNNFKEELGRGGSGAVYKGTLEDDRVVAVKRLGDALQGEEEFWAEVSTIGRINHMNLVRMWGFCTQGRHRLLVYEHLGNGSLDRHIFGRNFLGWKERFKVALGTAKALAYLHHECLEWVIHCDVKPENILLDSNFEAKVADFGLAKLAQRGGPGSEVSRIRGTKGYMAPEWALNLPITAKVDVYSYGVVILELVRGIRLSNWAINVGSENQEAELTRFIRIMKQKTECGENDWVEEMIDPRLKGEFSSNQVRKLVEIGISCIEEDRTKRPSMGSVVQHLVECEDEASIQYPMKL